jgi:ribonuclease R
MADGSEFKSFRDLGRSKGTEPPPREDGEGRGWTLEGDEGLSGTGEGDSAQSRIHGRPDAFGPMEEGPPPYRDLDSDEMRLLASFRIRTVFPPDVLRETSELPADPRPADRKDRLDLRGRALFTIDGEDAQDFDDAISIEEVEGGELEVGVHIADVAHYVRPGTALDAEALARGTSVYLPDQVVPMLPEALSNELCSLVPGRDRLAYSVLMRFDRAGRRTDARVAKSVIRSVRRNTYAEVQALLDGEGSLPKKLLALEEPLRLFQRWTKKQQELRDARGSLRIQSRERKFVFDEAHEVEAVVDAQKYFSNTLIEETALAANQAVGDLFRERGLPTIYRVHPEKDPEEVAAVAKMLAEHGIRVPTKERLTGRDVGRLIRTARNRPNADVLIQRIMGLVERATYEVKDHEDVAEHFGLAREAYLHFTSPIRRYPDLVVHRWLWSVESRGEEAAAELRADELVRDLNDTAAHASLQAEIAAMAEFAVGDLKVCQFLEPHVGERVDARITRLSPAGMEVHLLPFNVGGFLPMRALGDRPKLKGPTLTVRAGRRSLSFSEGRPVRVRIEDVDFLRLQVLLRLEA